MSADPLEQQGYFILEQYNSTNGSLPNRTVLFSITLSFTVRPTRGLQLIVGLKRFLFSLREPYTPHFQSQPLTTPLSREVAQCCARITTIIFIIVYGRAKVSACTSVKLISARAICNAWFFNGQMEWWRTLHFYYRTERDRTIRKSEPKSSELQSRVLRGAG